MDGDGLGEGGSGVRDHAAGDNEGDREADC
jgi:hypothetical protein